MPCITQPLKDIEIKKAKVENKVYKRQSKKDQIKINKKRFIHFLRLKAEVASSKFISSPTNPLR